MIKAIITAQLDESDELWHPVIVTETAELQLAAGYDTEEAAVLAGREYRNEQGIAWLDPLLAPSPSEEIHQPAVIQE